MKRKPEQEGSAGTDLAVDVLAWLAADEDRLLAFVATSGLAPGTLRESARDPAFLDAVLDFVMGDEAGLLACARDIGVKPERIAAAWHRRRPPDFED